MAQNAKNNNGSFGKSSDIWTTKKSEKAAKDVAEKYSRNTSNLQEAAPNFIRSNVAPERTSERSLWCNFNQKTAPNFHYSKTTLQMIVGGSSRRSSNLQKATPPHYCSTEYLERPAGGSSSSRTNANLEYTVSKLRCSTKSLERTAGESSPRRNWTLNKDPLKLQYSAKTPKRTDEGSSSLRKLGIQISSPNVHIAAKQSERNAGEYSASSKPNLQKTPSSLYLAGKAPDEAAIKSSLCQTTKHKDAVSKLYDSTKISESMPVRSSGRPAKHPENAGSFSRPTSKVQKSNPNLHHSETTLASGDTSKFKNPTPNLHHQFTGQDSKLQKTTPKSGHSANTSEGTSGGSSNTKRNDEIRKAKVLEGTFQRGFSKRSSNDSHNVKIPKGTAQPNSRLHLSKPDVYRGSRTDHFSVSEANAHQSTKNLVKQVPVHKKPLPPFQSKSFFNSTTAKFPPSLEETEKQLQERASLVNNNRAKRTSTGVSSKQEMSANKSLKLTQQEKSHSQSKSGFLYSSKKNQNEIQAQDFQNSNKSKSRQETNFEWDVPVKEQTFFPPKSNNQSKSTVVHAIPSFEETDMIVEKERAQSKQTNFRIGTDWQERPSSVSNNRHVCASVIESSFQETPESKPITFTRQSSPIPSGFLCSSKKNQNEIQAQDFQNLNTSKRRQKTLSKGLEKKAESEETRKLENKKDDWEKLTCINYGQDLLTSQTEIGDARICTSSQKNNKGYTLPTSNHCETNILTLSSTTTEPKYPADGFNSRETNNLERELSDTSQSTTNFEWDVPVKEQTFFPPKSNSQSKSPVEHVLSSFEETVMIMEKERARNKQTNFRIGTAWQERPSSVSNNRHVCTSVIESSLQKTSESKPITFTQQSSPIPSGILCSSKKYQNEFQAQDFQNSNKSKSRQETLSKGLEKKPESTEPRKLENKKDDWEKLTCINYDQDSLISQTETSDAGICTGSQKNNNGYTLPTSNQCETDSLTFSSATTEPQYPTDGFNSQETNNLETELLSQDIMSKKLGTEPENRFRSQENTFSVPFFSSSQPNFGSSSQNYQSQKIQSKEKESQPIIANKQLQRLKDENYSRNSSQSSSQCVLYPEQRSLIKNDTNATEEANRNPTSDLLTYQPISVSRIGTHQSITILERNVPVNEQISASFKPYGCFKLSLEKGHPSLEENDREFEEVDKHLQESRGTTSILQESQSSVNKNRDKHISVAVSHIQQTSANQPTKVTHPPSSCRSSVSDTSQSTTNFERDISVKEQTFFPPKGNSQSKSTVVHAIPPFEETDTIMEKERARNKQANFRIGTAWQQCPSSVSNNRDVCTSVIESSFQETSKNKPIPFTHQSSPISSGFLCPSKKNQHEIQAQDFQNSNKSKSRQEPLPKGIESKPESEEARKLENKKDDWEKLTCINYDQDSLTSQTETSDAGICTGSQTNNNEYTLPTSNQCKTNSLILSSTTTEPKYFADGFNSQGTNNLETELLSQEIMFKKLGAEPENSFNSQENTLSCQFISSSQPILGSSSQNYRPQKIPSKQKESQPIIANKQLQRFKDENCCRNSSQTLSQSVLYPEKATLAKKDTSEETNTSLTSDHDSSGFPFALSQLPQDKTLSQNIISQDKSLSHICSQEKLLSQNISSQEKSFFSNKFSQENSFSQNLFSQETMLSHDICSEKKLLFQNKFSQEKPLSHNICSQEKPLFHLKIDQEKPLSQNVFSQNTQRFFSEDEFLEATTLLDASQSTYADTQPNSFSSQNSNDKRGSSVKQTTNRETEKKMSACEDQSMISENSEISSENIIKHVEENEAKTTRFNEMPPVIWQSHVSESSLSHPSSLETQEDSNNTTQKKRKKQPKNASKRQKKANIQESDKCQESQSSVSCSQTSSKRTKASSKILTDAIATVLTSSINETFRGECFEALQVTNSQAAIGKLRSHFSHYVESTTPDGSFQNSEEPSQDVAQDFSIMVEKFNEMEEF